MVSWHGYFIQNLTTLISYRQLIGAITHDNTSTLDKLRATNYLFFWPYFPRIIKLTYVHLFIHVIFPISVKTTKLRTVHFPKILGGGGGGGVVKLDISFEIRHMNWNFKIQVDFLKIIWSTYIKPLFKKLPVLYEYR